MSWLKRNITRIQTPADAKKDTPDGLWYKTNKGGIIPMKELVDNAYVFPDDNFHLSISSEKYFSIFFDNQKYTELFTDLESADPLSFIDSKPYSERIKKNKLKTNLKDAIRVATGNMSQESIVLCCMDFTFIGGSMGSVVGEKISLAVDKAIEKKTPFIIISKSGGARMQEGAYSLMQMAKTAGKLTLLSKHRIPFFSILTHPCYGGVTASFGMLGDFIIAEPLASIGFAGPRVIKETMRKDLPKNFQKAESLFEYGFIDFIVDRREMKNKVSDLIKMLK